MLSSDDTGAVAGKVAILGLGNMGSALAEVQVRSGAAVTVWNRTRSRAEHLAAHGARVVETAREAFESSPVAILCAGHHDTGLALLKEAGSALKGRTVVSLTIGLPKHAVAMAELAEQHGAKFVEGVIMVFPRAIGTDDCRILYAAAEADYEEVQPVLASFGGSQSLVSSSAGSVSALGIASAGLFHLCFQSFATMAVLAERFGIGFQTSTPEFVAFLDVIGEAATTAGPALVGDVRTSDTSTISLGADEMRDILEAMRPLGLDTSLVRAVKDNLDRAVQLGYGGGPSGSVIHALDPERSGSPRQGP